ncbi:MAG: hypothetical protein LUE19_02230 [Clostridiales bacterium]|nr:hypothetical protein [Clostridiales bacterium]
MTFEVMIRIPHSELHDTVFNPDETEIGDVERIFMLYLREFSAAYPEVELQVK